MSISTTFRALAATSAAAALLVGSAGVAAAQNPVPGDGEDGRTVIVNDPAANLEITEVDRDAGTVDFTMTNESGANLTCEAANQNEENRPGATVSTAGTIARGEQFYLRHQVRDSEEFAFQESIFLVGEAGVLVQFWPLLQLVPTGSAAQMFSDRVMAQAEIVTGHNDALTSGLAGYDSSFSVDDGDTAERTVALSPPSRGERGDDDLGVIVMCGEGGTQGDQQLYAWTAYETGEAPPVGNGGTGSLDAGSLTGSADGSGEGS